MVKVSNKEEDEKCISKYKNTGSQRTFLLAEIQGVPENIYNYEIIFQSLNFASLGEDTQIVCDHKLVSILLGIQPITSMHESYKTNEDNKKQIKEANIMKLMKKMEFK